MIGASKALSIVTGNAGTSTATEYALKAADELGGKVATVLLTATYLTVKSIQQINEWYNGRISGRRLEFAHKIGRLKHLRSCVKTIVDETVTALTGVGGGVGGAAIGLLLGPTDTFVGVAVGGIGGALTASALAKKLTSYMNVQDIRSAAGRKICTV